MHNVSCISFFAKFHYIASLSKEVTCNAVITSGRHSAIEGNAVASQEPGFDSQLGYLCPFPLGALVSLPLSKDMLSCELEILNGTTILP